MNSDKLKSFLNDRGIYDMYIFEAGIDNHTIEWLLGDVEECAYISNAFIWDDSDAGHEFWFDIDAQWRAQHE